MNGNYQNPLRDIVDGSLKNLISIIISYKIAIFLLIIAAYLYLPFNLDLYLKNFIFLNSSPDIFTIFKTWDGQHYLAIAENAYPKEISESTAFYPLYPFIVKLVGIAFLGNTLLAGLLVSNICSILAVLYFYFFVKKLYDEKIAFTACLFMISFITFFYTSLVYTEGLFLLLVTAFFYYLYNEQFYPCLVTTLLLPLVRPTGILVIAPLFAILALEIWGTKKVHLNNKKILLLFGFIAGFLLYLGIMKCFTGSFFSGFDAQYLFVAQNSISNLFDPMSWFMRNFIDINYTVNGYTTSILNRIFFIVFLVLLYFIYQCLDLTLFVYSLVLGLLPALSGEFMSYIRFLSMVFPIFIVLALKFQKNPYALIIPLFLFQAFFAIIHSLNYWVA